MWLNRLDPSFMIYFTFIVYAIVIMGGFLNILIVSGSLAEDREKNLKRTKIFWAAFVAMFALTYANAASKDLHIPLDQTDEDHAYMDGWKECRATSSYDSCISIQDDLYKAAYGKERK